MRACGSPSAYLDADLQQFSLDPRVTPPRVLPSEAEHECPDVWIGRRTSRLARGTVGPLPPDEFAVPPEQRLGRDEEGGKPVPRKDVSRGGEEDAIEGAELRPPDLTAQDLQLVPEHRVLDLRDLPALGAGEGAKQASEQGVKHRHDHGAGMLPDPAGI